MGSRIFLYLEETICKIKSHGKWSGSIESLKVGNRAYELATDAAKCQEPIIQEWCYSKRITEGLLMLVHFMFSRFIISGVHI